VPQSAHEIYYVPVPIFTNSKHMIRAKF